MFFNAFDVEHGRELWISDGTAAGTRRVVDLCPGECSGNPLPLGVLDGELIFWARGGEIPGTRYWESFQLWRSDGTAGGTVRVAGVCDEGCWDDPQAVVQGGRLYFPADGPEGDRLLWRTAGTEETTAPVLVHRDGGDEELRIGSMVLGRLGDRLLLQTGEFRSGTFTFYRTTESGDRLEEVVRGCEIPANPGTGSIRPYGNRALFFAGCLEIPERPFGSANALHLWVTDGTPEGTVNLIPAAPISARPHLEGVMIGELEGDFYVARSEFLEGTGGDVEDRRDCGGHGKAARRGGRGLRCRRPSRRPTSGAVPRRSRRDALELRRHAFGTTPDRRGPERVCRPRGRPGDLRPSAGRGADTRAFPASGPDGAPTAAAPRSAAPPGRSPARLTLPSCGTTDTQLCLGGAFQSFAVTATYRNQYAGGAEGPGMAVPMDGDSGWFWFFDQDNPEILVKVLDGTPVNGHYWVFTGGLSTVEYEVTVTDTLSRDFPSKTYRKPAGTTCGTADVTAFPAF